MILSDFTVSSVINETVKPALIVIHRKHPVDTLFSVRYAAAARREIFGVNALRGKQQQLGSPNLQDIFIGG